MDYMEDQKRQSDNLGGINRNNICTRFVYLIANFITVVIFCHNDIDMNKSGGQKR